MVSIIASVYNCEQYIANMIQSIIAQSYQDWELIIIDDASTDGTKKIISEFQDERIIKISNSINRGLTVNLNYALKIAKGKYILRIDGDDIAYSNRLEKQVEYMECHPEIGLSGCWMKTFGGSKSICPATVDDARLRVKLILNACIYHPTFIIRKSVIERWHICYNEKLRYAQDYDLEYQISKVAKIGNLPEVLMHYRVHSKQITCEKQQQQLECANHTRLQILRDMQVDLEEEEFRIWVKLCVNTISDNEEYCIAVRIVKRIMDANERMKRYDSRLLKEMLKICLLRNRAFEIREKGIQNFNKYNEMFQFMFMWQTVKEKGKGLEDFFRMCKVKTIAIYGSSFLGKLIYDELEDSSIRIAYSIDQNCSENYISEKIDVFSPEEALPYADMIVVTPLNSFDSIRKSLEKNTKANIICIEEIVDCLYECSFGRKR